MGATEEELLAGKTDFFKFRNENAVPVCCFFFEEATFDAGFELLRTMTDRSEGKPLAVAVGGGTAKPGGGPTTGGAPIMGIPAAVDCASRISALV